MRTYGVQRAWYEHHPASFVQLRGYMEVQAGAYCKTVGSAYVGSNPTPATRSRRSEPVTLDCVTGFWRERERLRRPSAVSRGLCVGQIRPSPASGENRIIQYELWKQSACRMLGGLGPSVLWQESVGHAWAGDVDSRTHSGQGLGRSRRCAQLLAFTHCGGRELLVPVSRASSIRWLTISSWLSMRCR